MLSQLSKVKISQGVHFLLLSFLALFSSYSGFTTSTEQEQQMPLPRPTFVSVGTMSGTSMDGIDVAAIETDGFNAIRELGNDSLEYEPVFHLLLKTAEYAVRQEKGNLKVVRKKSFKDYFKAYLKNQLTLQESDINKQWHNAIHYLKKTDQIISFDDVVEHSTELHAQAIEKLMHKLNYKPSQVDIIGYHGQTLFHAPSSGITVQVGNGQQLAQRLKITVINDFRSRDVASGGQGAPFAPLYHQALAIRDNRYPVAIINCGGIANLTLVKGSSHKDLLGFDTGPGNGLIDLYIKRHTASQESMDKDGKYGLKGKADENILLILHQTALKKNNSNYFDIAPPKSLDINDMKLPPELDKLSMENACATLAAFTAQSIVYSFKKFLDITPQYWILAGGGWNNPVIKSELIQRAKNQLRPDTIVQTAEEVGWNNKAMEAQIFAYLAVRSLLGEPISIPETTKVPRSLSGGHAFLPGREISEKMTIALKNNPQVLTGYKQ
jgi:anhydro-N-acetylmuramic acid kinase